MDQIINIVPDHESHPILLEYDINDIKLSIQETIKTVEKFAFDKEIGKR